MSTAIAPEVVARVSDALARRGLAPQRERDGRTSALCPLCRKEGRTMRVSSVPGRLVTCSAGCAQEAILANLAVERSPATHHRAAKSPEPNGAEATPRNGATESNTWGPPIPFGQRAVPPFPVDALPTSLAEFVAAVSTATQTPVDLPGMLALSVVATATAKTARVRIADNWTEPLNIFAVVVLPPASRKSAVFSTVTSPLAAWERDEAVRVRPQRDAALARLELANKRFRRATELKDPAEDEVIRLAKEKSEIVVPRLPRLIADDTTPEALSSLLFEHGGRMAVLSTEGGVFEVMAGRYDSRGKPNLEVFLKGHTGDDFRVDRKGREAEFVAGPALTLGLAIQPDVLHALRDQPRFRGRGLLGRFLYALPHNTVGSRDADPPPVPPLLGTANAFGTCSASRRTRTPQARRRNTFSTSHVRPAPRSLTSRRSSNRSLGRAGT